MSVEDREQLRRVVASRRWLYTEIADAAGVSEKTVRKFVQGDESVGRASVGKIARGIQALQLPSAQRRMISVPEPLVYLVNAMVDAFDARSGGADVVADIDPSADTQAQANASRSHDSVKRIRRS